MTSISRREFASWAATSVAAPFAWPRFGGAVAITARDVADRITSHIGVPWRPDTVDGFKAGDPATVVTGIVTTALATMDVLARAVKTGANFVVTAEPTFFGRADNPVSGRGTSARDPVIAAKAAFIKEHNLVVWRFSDHWRLQKPDPHVHGLIETFGWTRFRLQEDPARVAMPGVTLDTLASQVKRKLAIRGGMRVVGDRRLNVASVGLLPGTTAIQAALTMLPLVDVIVAGEVREWESVEYVRDKVTAKTGKGLILVGRIVSHEPGMSLCARWLGALVPEVPARWIPAGDPYWRPA